MTDISVHELKKSFEVGHPVLIGIPKGRGDLARRFHPLDPYRQQHDPSQGPACPQNAQHIPHCRPRG